MRKKGALLPGSAELLLLQLLSEGDMYGYQMSEELSRRSDETFEMKAGTLYPILHGLEQAGKVESYEKTADDSGRCRRYYRITRSGRAALSEQKKEWQRLSAAVNAVLGEGFLARPLAEGGRG